MKTNICSFYKDGLIQAHQRGGDVGKTYKQKKLQTCKWELSSSGDGCSTKQRTQSYKLLTWDQICFFVWLMWKTVYLGKSVALHLSCNANSNPSLAASLTPNQNHKPGNFKMIFIHIIQCCKLDTTRLKYTDAQSTKQHISPFQFQFLQVVKLWAKLKEEKRILQTLLFRWLWRPWKEANLELQAWHTFDSSLRIQNCLHYLTKWNQTYKIKHCQRHCGSRRWTLW